MKRLSLDDFHVKTSFQVLWGDMDAAQHVNNLIYLKWSETARLLYFQEMGMDVSFGPGAPGPILGWQDCKYTFPVIYPDKVLGGVRTIEILEDRFTLQCALFSQRHQRLAAVSLQTIVPYDYGALKKVSMPEEWLAGIRGIEGVKD
ncbi:MAG: thioesterase family protein [Bacteroidota bacterium]